MSRSLRNVVRCTGFVLSAALALQFVQPNGAFAQPAATYTLSKTVSDPFTCGTTLPGPGPFTSSTSADIGDCVLFYIQIHNNDPTNDINNLTITDTVAHPQRLVPQGQGNSCPGFPSGSGSTCMVTASGLTFQSGGTYSLAAGATGFVQFVARVAAGTACGSAQSNTASATASHDATGYTSFGSSPTATVYVTCTTPPPSGGLSLSKSVDGYACPTTSSCTANRGDVLTYTLTYQNNTGGTANGVTVVDTLDTDLTYTGSTSPCTPLSSGGTTTVTCNIGNVSNAGTTGSVSINARVNNVPNGTSITNTGQISASNVSGGTAMPSNTTYVYVNTVNGPGPCTSPYTNCNPCTYPYNNCDPCASPYSNCYPCTYPYTSQYCGYPPTGCGTCNPNPCGCNPCGTNYNNCNQCGYPYTNCNQCGYPYTNCNTPCYPYTNGYPAPNCANNCGYPYTGCNPCAYVYSGCGPCAYGTTCSPCGTTCNPCGYTTCNPCGTTCNPCGTTCNPTPCLYSSCNTCGTCGTGAPVICGVVVSYSPPTSVVPGALSLGSQNYTIPMNTTFGNVAVANGGYFCFILGGTGYIVGCLSAIPTSITSTPGQHVASHVGSIRVD